METAGQEIWREKVLIPSEMSRKEIMQKYGVAESCASSARKEGWLIKNYSTNQVIIDCEHFNPAISYSIAKQVFWKRFGKNPAAISIKKDLIQEAVSLMFMQSGKIKAGANEKFKLLPAEAGRFDGGLEDRHYFSLLERKNRHASIG